MTSLPDHQPLLSAFCEELARCGLRDACTSPGSRCAPLVLALTAEQQLRCHSHIDERGAGFFALGLAKASYRPVALTCTSGTAVAELLPAVVEAHEARVPLIVLSADRPSELRDIGAGQTIDQLNIFGRFAKWFFEVGTHECSEASVRWLRTLACRAYWTAVEGRPGVVHLNFALREPLVSGRAAAAAAPGGRSDGQPYVRRLRLYRDEEEANMAWSIAHAVGDARRVALVAGRFERDEPVAEAASELCQSRGWVLLADPMSGARIGDAAIAHYDALLRMPTLATELAPEAVLRLGDLPVSKPLRQWLGGLTDIPQIALDPEGAWQDPASVLSQSFDAEISTALWALGKLSDAEPDPDWLPSWRAADECAAAAIGGVLAPEGLSEPTVAAELGALLPWQATLFVASSMPVRDIESFWPVREDPPRVLCNRGANGIDGTVSSAFGAAATGGGPVVLLIGDVAFAHDLGGLLAGKRLGLKLTIVLIDNDGGGIFDFLPVSDAPLAFQADRYREHIATPTGLDFAKAADLYGLEHEPVSDVAGFRAALEHALAAPRSTLIEVKTERAANVDLHRRAWEAVARALAH
ncbi:MAG: 2-succinyl-5-enolpyruvyl-6-hydroxy-3-cyclohexene-1-carboxylic-acid synthase [Solirubrobacteraceae bacterium]